MEEKERIQKSFEFVQEASKQLISLATLILGLTMTFFKDLAEEYDKVKSWFPLAMLAFLLSILGGIFVLLNLSGTLGKIKEIESKDVSVYRNQIRIWMYVQIIFFIGGLLLGIFLVWQSG